MSKFTLLLASLLYSNAAITAQDKFTLENITIKIPPFCTILDSKKHTLTCKLDVLRDDIDLRFHIDRNFHDNVIDSNRKKIVQKIGENDFVQFMIGDYPFNFLFLKKCNLVIAGNDANFLFSTMTDIKIDNEICR